MKIGILQTGLVPEEMVQETGQYVAFFERMLAGRGFTFAGYSVVEGLFPDRPEDADGWLITGSKFGVYEDYPWIRQLEELVRAIYAQGRPMVGVCFGHQIIAKPLGGQGRESSKAAGPCGPQDLPDMGGRDVTLHAWHQDQVIEAPKDAQTFGAIRHLLRNAALVYGSTRPLPFQPHPEFTRQILITDGLIRFRGPGNVPDDILTGGPIRPGHRAVDNALLADQYHQLFQNRGQIS